MEKNKRVPKLQVGLFTEPLSRETHVNRFFQQSQFVSVVCCSRKSGNGLSIVYVIVELYLHYPQPSVSI